MIDIDEQAERIDELKKQAREANDRDDQEALGVILKELDAVWTDDRAAMAFYTSLEQQTLRRLERE